ncbi:hypothetical protein [Fonticella tunisiensis]|nr:hypothetical protein [Fonticella tunisiensis]
MIQVLAGEKGAGKTKKLFSIANELSQQSKGHLVYISNNSEGIFELSPLVRLIDTSQFPISSYDSFTGFIFGVISQDYDIEVILIDNLTSILNEDREALFKFLSFAKKVSDDYGIKLILGVKGRSEALKDIEAEYIAV